MTQPQPPEKPPAEHRFREYEDPHYHDDAEVVLPADEDDEAHKAAARRKARNKFLSKKPYREDD
jgi:hypothetical protein